jgi:hypothetical protein
MRQAYPPFESGDPAMPALQQTRSVNASYRALRRARQTAAPAAPAEEYAEGPGDWLAPMLPPEAAQLTDPALAQRAEPNAWCALVLIVVGLGLAVGGLANAHLLVAAGLLLVGALLAVALNRASAPGWSAGALVMAALVAPLAVALLSAPGDPALALDALVAPVLLAGVLLAPRAPLLVGGVSALACALVVLPRQFGHEPAQSALGLLLNGDLLVPVGLILLVTLLAWLWAAAVERALTRTATTAAAMARYSALDEQQTLLGRGLQTLLATLAQVASGHYGARVDGNARTLLWQLAAPVNALIARLAASAQADQRLRATDRAIDQLAAALEQSHHSQAPIWPAASGTRVDRLTGLFATTMPRMLPVPLPPAAGLGAMPTATPHAARPTGSRALGAAAASGFMPALPRHRAPGDFTPGHAAGSYPPAALGTSSHAAARQMERRWASHPLPPLDATRRGGAPGAAAAQPTIAQPTVPQPRPRTPSWPLDAAAATAIPAWLEHALGQPAHRAGRAPTAPPARSPESPTAMPTEVSTTVPAATSARQPPVEVEWSATGEVPAIAASVPPAQSWTVVPVVPAEVERPEWPDFLITLEAAQRGSDDQDGADGDA